MKPTSIQSAVHGLKLAAFLGSLTLAALPVSLAAGEEFNPAQRAEIEKIVHDYLISHPEVMFEVAESIEKLQQQQAKQTLDEVITSLRTDKDNPMKGGADKAHYLIEFFDYNCGYCKVVRQLSERLSREHDLQTIYIEYPILSAASVQAAAVGLALYAMDPDKYFAYQTLLMTQGKKVESLADIEAALKQVEADVEAVKRRAGSDETQNQLRFNLQQGQRIGVTGTPCFIIDGKIVRGAVRDYETLERMAGFAPAADADGVS